MALTMFEKELDEFRDHVERVRHQYSAMRTLRENLPENELLIWMDFAENFGCVSVDEIQSAYWNSSMISLHTMIIYYPGGRVQSEVAVSDVLSHNATAVFTILRKLVPELKKEIPSLKRIHYLTDSPTSQYRNKTIFQFVAGHQQEFGISARWSYLESGHGKGPCDGLGASVKRAAGNAVKHGKCSIQSGIDFMRWAESSVDSGSKVRYFLYTQEDCATSDTMLAQRVSPCPVKGTFKIHYVVDTGVPNEIYSRQLSCYCEKCIIDISRTECSGYQLHRLDHKRRTAAEVETAGAVDDTGSRADDTRSRADVTGSRADETGGGADETTDMADRNTVPQAGSNNQKESAKSIQKGSWVAATYQKKLYVGRVMDIDEDDGEYHVTFLEESGKYGNNFKWPTIKDDLWMTHSDIICPLEESPTASGKRGRLLKLSTVEMKRIQDLAAQKK